MGKILVDQCSHGHRRAEISSSFVELESTFYKHKNSHHPDVFKASDEPNESRTGIVMICVYVIGNKKTKLKSFKVLSRPVVKQVSLF